MCADCIKELLKFNWINSVDGGHSTMEKPLFCVFNMRTLSQNF